MASRLSRRDQKVHSIFKNVLIGAPRPFIQMVSKRKGVFIEMDLLPIVITNSFKIQNQTFEKHFHFLSFSLTLWSWNLFLFRNISEIQNDKIFETQVHLFHAHANIKVRFTFLKKYIHEWKHSWSKDKQMLPLVNPLS